MRRGLRPRSAGARYGAVIAGDDAEALWAWLNTSSGEDDVQAWRRFLVTIPHGDGRRGLAAERLERLRALFGAHDVPVPPQASVRERETAP